MLSAILDSGMWGPATPGLDSTALLHCLLCMYLPQSLANSKRDASLDGRLRAIIDTLTSDVYSYTCLGLFERHKLMFSFQMAIKILEIGPAPLDAQV